MIDILLLCLSVNPFLLIQLISVRTIIAVKGVDQEELHGVCSLQELEEGLSGVPLDSCTANVQLVFPGNLNI